MKIMRFNLGLILRGKPIISAVEKNKRFNRINLELDRFGNKSSLSFDSICLTSFIEAVAEYSEKGQVSYAPSEGCQGQVDLDFFSLDLSNDRFFVRLGLADVRGGCSLVLQSGSVRISLCFSEAQIEKIIDKFNNVVNLKEALGEAEKEVEV